MTKAKLGTFAKNSNVNPMNSNPRCKGQTKTGKPCRAAAVSAGKCLFRANPKKVSAVRDAVEGKLHPQGRARSGAAFEFAASCGRGDGPGAASVELRGGLGKGNRIDM